MGEYKVKLAREQEFNWFRVCLGHDSNFNLWKPLTQKSYAFRKRTLGGQA
jgi:hypothetical protein